MSEKCEGCGAHPLRYIDCDRWDCPNLMLEVQQEGELPENRACSECGKYPCECDDC